MQKEYKIKNDYHTLMESDKWVYEIPSLKFNNDLEVKVIPPFSGAVVRFIISKDDARVSVYLDCYDNLGYYGSPYWEIYPAVDGDVFRCDMKETKELLHAINKSVNNQLI